MATAFLPSLARPLPRAGRRADPVPLARSRPATTSGASVEIRGLSKRFGEKTVLSGIDLEVRPGEFLAIVGRSGCGKSTLLRLLLGLEKAGEGRIVIGSGEGGRTASRFVFQEPRLLPWQRVATNVALGADRALGAAERQRLAGEALAQVGLADRGGEWPSILSGGQRQRVALARALVSRPGLLALDEPLGALDALTRIEMQALLESVWRREGFTALLVTHDVSEAVALADRIVLIEEGRIVLEENVALPRPRRRGSVEAGAIEQRILDRLLRRN